MDLSGFNTRSGVIGTTFPGVSSMSIAAMWLVHGANWAITLRLCYYASKTSVSAVQHRLSPALQAARRMPLLPHYRRGEPFDIMRSKAVDWLVSQPEVRQEVWNWCKRNDVIILDLEQQRWRGVEWGCESPREAPMQR